MVIKKIFMHIDPECESPDDEQNSGLVFKEQLS